MMEEDVWYISSKAGGWRKCSVQDFHNLIVILIESFHCLRLPNSPFPDHSFINTEPRVRTSWSNSP